MADDLKPHDNGSGISTAVAAQPTARRAWIEQQPEPQPEPAPPVIKRDATHRLLSLDAYRGLIMVTLAFTGFGLAGTAREHLKQDPNGDAAWFWRAVYHQFEHVEWAGCGYWDLIQPSFMFMVGVAMAFSYAKRQQLGQSYRSMLGHAMVRSLVLIFLGIYFSAKWELMNVLTQIGLGYTFLFLLWGRSLKTQAIAAGGILVGTWLLYMLYPTIGIASGEGDPSVGVPAAWSTKHLLEVGPNWHKNSNVGHAIDVRILNLLPNAEPFQYNRGGYQTINFIPSLATMLFGLMCGELLRSDRKQRNKLLILLAAGIAGILFGLALEKASVSPLVKRIWTPSWAVFSTGWCCLILMGLYGTIDVLGFRRWAFPLVVVGMNSIAIYSMGQLLRGHTNRFWHGVASPAFDWVGPLYTPMLECTLTGLLFWFVCLWMYRQRIFIRI
jgi:predicted acyltransferase